MNQITAIAAETPRGFVRARDGALLHVKAWGAGPPVVFLHSWALNADMWEYQMTPLAEEGRRVIAFDRRGHGRSEETEGGYDLDALADDVADVMAALDVRGATLVGHSMGCAEAVRYLARHGQDRVERLVLLAPVTPAVRQSPTNPNGVPAEMIEQMRAAWRRDRAGWMADNARPFVTPDTSQAMLDWMMALMLQPSLRVWLACNAAFASQDQSEELKALRLPTLVVQGDADASAPLELTGRRTAALVPGADLRVYPKAPHALFATHIERVNADLSAFIAA